MAGRKSKKNGKNNNGSSEVVKTNNGVGPTTNGSIKQQPVTKVTTVTTTTTTTTTTVKSNNDEITTTTNGIHISDILFFFFVGLGLLYGLINAYQIRLHAIKEYGPVIHEFDPYFNYRATEYLYYNGMSKFFTWFDHKSWYPLGRPVGTTIYPGMQFTAVFIKNYIVGESMSLNDVCCYIPAWFGVFATLLAGMITYECTLECNTNTHIFAILWDLIRLKGVDEEEMMQSKKKSPGVNVNSNSWLKWKTAVVCAVVAINIMAIVPAHMMRSIGGGFDNESVAMSTMLLTFYFWVRSLRGGEKYSYLFGILAGIAYFYMVATWGGYVFVLNMVGLHAAILVGLGRFSTKLYLSFTLFYVIGTTLAIQIPVVGLTPLKSLEQLGCCAIFIGYQVLFISERMIRQRKLSKMDAWKFRISFYVSTLVVGVALLALCLPRNYFGPISSRVRGLFVKHTKTGNPLVDSVAEHQPAQANAYYQYLHQLCTYGPIGFVFVLCYFGESPSFLSAFAAAAYFFSLKMVRLVLLMAPIASILGGVSGGRILMWCFSLMFQDKNDKSEIKSVESKKKKSKKGGKGVKVDNDDSIFNEFKSHQDEVKELTQGLIGSWLKKTIAFLLLLTVYFSGIAFQDYCWGISKHLSNPSIIVKAKKRDGTIVKIDDYREAYWWIRDNTPEDARIMAWWDYGYQISAIANRTTIADGNTWNHEHIALLGKIYTTDVDEAYSIARHLADYILVWSGGGGDDLAKSPHLARIANSVYRDFCPGDPVCSSFGLVPAPRGKEHLAIRPGVMASPKMQASLVNHLVSNGMREVEVNPAQFREVFRSKYAKVRIYEIVGVDEESKKWGDDPKNKICDAPGSWFCRGQYPPALQEVLEKGKTFVQLEDFNKKEDDTEYQKLYMEKLAKQREERKQREADMRKKARESGSARGDL